MPRRRVPTSPFRYFKSAPEVIRAAVMLYIRYPLSLRNVEDLLFERGYDLCHETVRLWWQVRPHVCRGDPAEESEPHAWSSPMALALGRDDVRVNGEMRYLWRAVDHEGEILESFVTKTRDKGAALAFMKKAMKRHGHPEKIVTDGLRSYGAAMTELGNAEKREVGRWLNNRVENSHLPFRRRERAMQRFRQMKTLQKSSSVHAQVHNHFNQERHLVDRQTYKQRRSAALAEWQIVVA